MNIEDIRDEIARLEIVAPLEGQRYSTCLQTYEAASNQRELILGWFTERVIPELSTDNTSILSVGCGEGELDVKILAAGKERVSAISYSGLDPDARQCARFVSRLESESGQHIRVNAYNNRFENFTEAERFDLVIMVHSLYYMDDPEWAVKNALNLVRRNGRLVILIASNDTLNELSSSFWSLEKGRSAWFSEDLSSHLERNGVTFEHKRIEAMLDITACFDPESEQGGRIADFVAQVPTKELPAQLRRMIFSYLRATSRPDGNTRWLPHNVDAFVIHPLE